MPTAKTPIKELQFNIETGDDDLRSGSSAFAVIRIPSLSKDIVKSLNEKANWKNNSSHSVTVPLPEGMTYGHIHSISVRFQSGSSGPFDTNDNWNLNGIKISFPKDNHKTGLIYQGSGDPLHRFSDRNPTWDLWHLH